MFLLKRNIYNGENAMNKARTSLQCCIIFICFILMCKYIECATMDFPVINDYVRVINNYIGKGKMVNYLCSTSFVLQPPAALLGVWINWHCFGFSVYFDYVLGIIGLSFCAMVVVKYSQYYNINLGMGIVLILYVFSLSKWEMIINGTGWVHFVCFSLIALHFYLLDINYEQNIKKNEILLMVLPSFNILLFAIFYSAAYSMTILAFYGLVICRDLAKKNSIKKELKYIGAQIVPFLFYVVMSIINSDLRVTSGKGFFWYVFHDFKYIIKFFIASFSAEAIGVETLMSYENGMKIALVIGGSILILYLLCGYSCIKHMSEGGYIFPLLLLVNSLFSHVLVCYSRCAFEDVTYGMSSRYALQYMLGGLGILIVLYKTFDRNIKDYKKINSLSKSIFCMLILGIIIWGNGKTTADEVYKAPYRKAYYMTYEDVIRHPDQYTIDDLAGMYNTDGYEALCALMTLKREKLSIWQK